MDPSRKAVGAAATTVAATALAVAVLAGGTDAADHQRSMPAKPSGKPHAPRVVAGKARATYRVLRSEGKATRRTTGVGIPARAGLDAGSIRILDGPLPTGVDSVWVATQEDGGVACVGATFADGYGLACGAPSTRQAIVFGTQPAPDAPDADVDTRILLVPDGVADLRVVKDSGSSTVRVRSNVAVVQSKQHVKSLSFTTNRGATTTQKLGG